MTAGPRPKVKCPVCGTEFGDLVSACPKCGAMNPAHRGGPPTTHVAPGPAPYSPPPAQPAYYGQQPPPGQPGYYGQPPAGAPPPGYGQYPGYQQQYPPGYGYPPQPQKSPASGLIVLGTLCYLFAMFTALIGVMGQIIFCGITALIGAIVGVCIGAVAMAKDPKRGKIVLAINIIVLVMILVIIIIELAVNNVI